MKHIVPKEALNWFANKNLKPSFNHLDVYGQEHSKAFTVAKAMELDVLVDIRDAAQKALADGQTFQQFRAELTPTLQKKGWWGRQKMTDPQDGRLKEVQLGSARRLRTIYRTNMRTARAAGQWQRIQRTSTSHPYLIYSLGPSENHRQQHVSWNKLVLPVNDPFWKTHYPPNGWGCKCRVRQASAAEAKRLGINTAPKIETSEWVNKRTGQVHQIPKGIDPSWNHNPGENPNQLIGLFSEKLDTAPVMIAKQVLVKFVQSNTFHTWYRNPQGTIPLALMPKHHMASIGAKSPVIQLASNIVAKHPDIQIHTYSIVQSIIDKGWSILKGSSRVYVWETAGYVTVINISIESKVTLITSLRLLSKAQSKQNKELQSFRKKAGK
jgi:hypothetical protein